MSKSLATAGRKRSAAAMATYAPQQTPDALFHERPPETVRQIEAPGPAHEKTRKPFPKNDVHGCLDRMASFCEAACLLGIVDYVASHTASHAEPHVEAEGINREKEAGHGPPPKRRNFQLTDKEATHRQANIQLDRRGGALAVGESSATLPDRTASDTPEPKARQLRDAQQSCGYPTPAYQLDRPSSQMSPSPRLSGRCCLNTCSRSAGRASPS
jgi:hypothetical protein